MALAKSARYALAFFFAIGAAGIWREHQIARRADHSKSATVQPAAPTPISLDQLRAEFDGNSIAAERKYRDQKLPIRATVQSVDTLLGYPIVRVRGAQLIFQRGEENRVIHLRPGTVLEATCHPLGTSFGLVQFNRCD